ncbi:MAG TPA: hypothetical protein VM680_08640 [Verrucomicrobiae bacterium]|nr:hypothetical protein [Verrucomicrobiae bacterium]
MSDFERLDVQEREEKAALYVMGELGEVERRAFEAEMGESAELMQVVRELEEGATAVGMACPPRRVPPFMWERIERAVEAEERKVVPLFGSWGGVWRNAGWAAAACFAAWIFVGVYRSDTNSRKVGGGVAVRNSTAETTNFVGVGHAAGTDGQRVVERKNEVAVKEAREREAERLRADVENLQRQMGAMSQMITQQQAMLGEPNRFKFLTLAPTANAAPIDGLSPQLQRALFLAMARELGWLNASNEVANPMFEDRSRGGGTNAMNVDFVDFRNTNGAPVRLKAQQETKDAQTAETPNDGAMQLASATAVPAFATADHVVMAFDPSVISPGSEATVSLSEGGETHVIGLFSMGHNPTVVSFVSREFADGGATVQLVIRNPGTSNFIEFAPAVVRAWNPATGGGNALKAEATP